MKVLFSIIIFLFHRTHFIRLNMLEISPTNGRDENYFREVINDKIILKDQRTDAALQRIFTGFYEFVTGKYNGLMVYSGSPGYGIQ